MAATTLTPASLTIGADLYIRMAQVVSHCSVGSAGVSCQIVDSTAKAIRIQGYVGEKPMAIWLPRKALVKLERLDGSDTVFCSLAGWFKVEGYTAYALDRLTTASAVSAA